MYPSFILSRPVSLIPHPTSVIAHSSSHISHPISLIPQNFSLSLISPFSSLSHHPSSPQPTTLHPQPYPSTLNPQPSTFNLQPSNQSFFYASNPPPSTLGFSTFILQPSTIKSFPSFHILNISSLHIHSLPLTTHDSSLMLSNSNICIFFSSDNFAWKSTHKNKSCMVLPNSSRFSRNFSENIAKISDFIFAKFRDIQDNFVQISCFMKF